MKKAMSAIGSELVAASCGEPMFELAEHGEKPQEGILDEKISNIFFAIGIQANIKGYFYLREAVKLAAGNFEMLSSITKKLYPLVASRFNTNTGNVARDIHNAIEIAWSKGKIVNLNAIFGVAVFEHNDKPSNGELIALLAERIHFDSI